MIYLCLKNVLCAGKLIFKCIVVCVSRAKPAIIKSDHHYPGTRDVAVTVILYAQIGTETFNKYHQILQPMAAKQEINYVLRHYIKVRASPGTDDNYHTINIYPGHSS